MLVALALLSHVAMSSGAIQYEPYVDAGTLMVARAIQGEEAGRFGSQRSEFGRWIAHVAYNRYEKEWWQRIDGIPCTFAERTAVDFHGTALVPEDKVEAWALRIAQEVITERRDGGTDGTRGALFAMSFDDLQAHGWVEQAAKTVVRVFQSPTSSLVQFWFTVGDPGKEAGK